MDLVAYYSYPGLAVQLQPAAAGVAVAEFDLVGVDWGVLQRSDMLWATESVQLSVVVVGWALLGAVHAAAGCFAFDGNFAVVGT